MILTKKNLLCCTALLAGGVFGAIFTASAASIGTPAAPRDVAFTVMLPLRNPAKLEALVARQQDPASADYHKWLTPAGFAAQYGPSADSMAQVAQALRGRGFVVTPRLRSLRVSGPVDLVERTFATSLHTVKDTNGHTHLAAATQLHPIAELTEQGAEIVGFHRFVESSMARSAGRIPARVDNRFGPNGAYFYDDLRQAYSYPSHVASVQTPSGSSAPFDGTGATIGVVIASDVLDSDIKLIFDSENYSTTTGTPDPTLFARRPVDGGAPFNPDSDDSFEASLDVQQELAGAPGAHVVLYNIASLDDADIIDGYTAVVDDDLVDAVSSSFGECELYYTAKYNDGVSYTSILAYEHQIYLQGNAEGITFLASSGDAAGKACITASYFYGDNGKYIAGVSTPAADPNVTAVGGTNLVTVYDPPTLESGYAAENAWLDEFGPSDPFGFGTTVTGADWGAGGGTSQLFPAPPYQSKVVTGATMRAVPDVGMQVGGCPEGAIDYNPTLNVCNGGNLTYNGSGNTNRSAAVVAFDGNLYGVIGTSVASPEFTSVLALLIEKEGRVGDLGPHLYSLAAKQAAGGPQFYHTLIPGYNGVVQSNVSSSFNVSTGVGTPIVTTFLGSPNVATAGVPQTISNP